MKRVVVISGAGISAESGLKTFRGADGLWRGYRPEEVACPEAWRRNPGLVLDFYNERRKAVREARPNAAHRALVELERAYDVRIVTQNVDDLHERAGSSSVLHLHGEIRKARSTQDPALVTLLGDGDIELGDTCTLGSQLRPHIVWFGESVPAMPSKRAISSVLGLFKTSKRESRGAQVLWVAFARREHGAMRIARRELRQECTKSSQKIGNVKLHTI